MSHTSGNNKRIAKNTLMLYFRMLVTMGISLFTSRVVFNALGVENYGIYNVVVGVVVLFTFINNAMATGTQRHISYELGKENGRVAEIFSACLKIHMVLGALVVVSGEAVGLWIINNKLNIPAGRMLAANIIYHIALVNCFVCIVKAPYDAAVVAYEKMSFYAYMSIFDAVAKLLTVFVLMVMPFDKLVTYSSFILVVTTAGFLIQACYAHRKLSGIRVVPIKDKKLYQYLLSFSGWTLFGSISGMLESQGIMMIVNITFGVTLNAAAGIANQVRGIISQFVNGFQQALNPQLVMTESAGDRSRQFDLIIRSAKFSFFIMFALSLPIMANLHQILSLWLGQVPAYTVSICMLVIILQLFECMSSPLYTTIFAIGHIKTYQVVVALFRSLSVASAFAVARFGWEPYMVYVMPSMVGGLLLVYRVWFIHRETAMSVGAFAKGVVWPVIAVSIVTILPLCAYRHFVAASGSLLQLAAETCCIAALTVAAIVYIGFAPAERAAIFQQVGKFIRKKRT